MGAKRAIRSIGFAAMHFYRAFGCKVTKKFCKVASDFMTI